MKKVTGIGGVFIQYNDVENAKTWYQKHLGIDIGQYGATFKWAESNDGNVSGQTVFSLFKKEDGYFKPSRAPFMINFRVDNLTALLKELNDAGVTQIGKTEEFPYGKFAWILDPEGNKIELREPIDDQL